MPKTVKGSPAVSWECPDCGCDQLSWRPGSNNCEHCGATWNVAEPADWEYARLLQRKVEHGCTDCLCSVCGG